MNAVDFNIPEIEAFVAVARTRSFRAAADELNTAQSSISQRVGRLESRLGHTLIARTTRRVEITPAGRGFLVYATAILGLADQVRKHFDQPPKDGVLKLAIAEDYATSDLHVVLSLFRKHYPRFGFTLRSGLSGKLFDALDDGRLDVVLAKRLPGQSRGELLFRDRLLWVGRESALGAPTDAVPLALFPDPSQTRTSVLAALRDAGRDWSIVVESEGMALLAAAVKAGLAVSAFSERFVRDPDMILGAAAGLPPLGELEYVIAQRPKPRDPAIDAFVNILSAAARATVESGDGD